MKNKISFLSLIVMGGLALGSTQDVKAMSNGEQDLLNTFTTKWTNETMTSNAMELARVNVEKNQLTGWIQDFKVNPAFSAFEVRYTNELKILDNILDGREKLIQEKAKIEGEVVVLQGTVANLQATTESLSGKIENLTSQIKAATANEQAAKTTLSGEETQLSNTLKAELTPLKVQYSADQGQLTAAFSALNAKRQLLKSTLTSYKQNLDEARDAYKQASETLAYVKGQKLSTTSAQATLDELSTQMTEVEKETSLASSKVSSELKTLQDNVEKDQKSVSDLKKAMEGDTVLEQVELKQDKSAEQQSVQMNESLVTGLKTQIGTVNAQIGTDAKEIKTDDTAITKDKKQEKALENPSSTSEESKAKRRLKPKKVASKESTHKDKEYL